MEKREPLHIVDGNENWYGDYKKNSTVVPQKIKNLTSNLTPGYISKGIEISISKG